MTYSGKENKDFRLMIKEKYIFTNKIFVMIIAGVCALLWGNMMPAVMVGFDLLGINQGDISSEILFAGLCFTFAGILTLLFCCVKENRVIFINELKISDVIIVGAVQTTLQYILLYTGLMYTSGVNASIISSSGTFFIIILAHFVYKNDKIDLYKSIGCISGLLGIIILNFDSINCFNIKFTFKGEGLIFLSTLTFVFMTPLCKKVCKMYDASVFTAYNFILGGIPLILIGIFGKGSIYLTMNGVLMLIGIILEASVAGVLWNYLLKYNKVSSISIYNLLVPIFGVLSSNFMLNENTWDVKNLFSLFFTCVGIYCVEKESKKLSLDVLQGEDKN